MCKFCARRNVELASEAVVLDMGLYTVPGFPFSVGNDATGVVPPLPRDPHEGVGSLTRDAAHDPAHAQPHPPPPPAAAPVLPAHASARSSSSGWGLEQISEAGGAAPPPPPPPLLQQLHQAGAGAVGVSRAPDRSGVGKVGCLRLYQVLAPKLIDRAHLFGNRCG